MFLAAFGGPGSAIGQLKTPMGVATDGLDKRLGRGFGERPRQKFICP